MNVQDMITEGFRAYPLSNTIGTSNVDYWREQLRKRYSLYSVVDEKKGILYVKYKFD